MAFPHRYGPVRYDMDKLGIPDYTQGVAYSESGTLDGPGYKRKNQSLRLTSGHGMLFRTLDGEWMMSVHSHKDVNGRYIRIPHLFKVDLSGDKLKID